VYRIMAYPDGERLGKQAIVEGTSKALQSLTTLLSDPAATRALLCGDESN